MQVINISIPSFNKNIPNVCALGYFDGVHLGHQKLIKETIDKAHQLGINSAILTFSSSIDLVLGKEFPGEITPLNTKLKIFEELGLDVCFVFEFNKDMASLDPRRFISDVLKPLNSRLFVCGNDFRYGFMGAGTPEMLQEYAPVDVIDFLNVENKKYKISSRNIIKTIQNGSVEEAGKLLGRPYFIEGEVVKGLGNGKLLGFPTANIDYKDFVLPMNGVYACKAEIDGKNYKSIVNIGTHPTINELKKPSIEVHILNFNENIYKKIIKVSFIKFIRKEKKFSDIENLKSQLNLDTFFDF